MTQSADNKVSELECQLATHFRFRRRIILSDTLISLAVQLRGGACGLAACSYYLLTTP
jgi:hypothetical protein